MGADRTVRMTVRGDVMTNPVARRMNVTAEKLVTGVEVEVEVELRSSTEVEERMKVWGMYKRDLEVTVSSDITMDSGSLHGPTPIVLDILAGSKSHTNGFSSLLPSNPSTITRNSTPLAEVPSSSDSSPTSSDMGLLRALAYSLPFSSDSRLTMSNTGPSQGSFLFFTSHDYS
ncbi:hypothetical protein ZIOFF_072351 [Zingiber officinale]|uniref:Uncharacterized protein n=1 Tax=Zingiber officinale TaxID=94328 RepID=A0A8J5EC50_ZINOF|nr:hypothetical protein ZIOFF_072351 [Zingiber officinale]